MPGRQADDAIEVEMIYCDNVACEDQDEPIERISDYRIIDGSVICVGCVEMAEDEDEMNVLLYNARIRSAIVPGRRG